MRKTSLRPAHLIKAWGGILTGRAPLMTIEITRECPLACPGCYAYNDMHLGGTKLRDLSDFSGDELVRRVIKVVRRHRPLHVSLVGGEPMIRHRELNEIIPALIAMGVSTMVVTSGVIPIPKQWMNFENFRVTVSVDGLPEHHNVRRKPATYERILRNIAGYTVNVHWTITHDMVLQGAGYLEEFVRFWSERPEVNFMWTSLYSPQVGEQSPDMITPDDRELLAREFPRLGRKYPKFLMNPGLAQTYQAPPRDPNDCIFSIMSVNYSADMKTRVEPCIFGGDPDCSQCGCAISVALHWVGHRRVLGPLAVRHLVRGSMAVGSLAARLRPGHRQALRWERDLDVSPNKPGSLVQLSTERRTEEAAASEGRSTSPAAR